MVLHGENTLRWEAYCKLPRKPIKMYRIMSQEKWEQVWTEHRAKQSGVPKGLNDLQLLGATTNQVGILLNYWQIKHLWPRTAEVNLVV